MFFLVILLIATIDSGLYKEGTNNINTDKEISITPGWVEFFNFFLRLQPRTSNK